MPQDNPYNWPWIEHRNRVRQAATSASLLNAIDPEKYSKEVTDRMSPEQLAGQVQAIAVRKTIADTGLTDAEAQRAIETAVALKRRGPIEDEATQAHTSQLKAIVDALTRENQASQQFQTTYNAASGNPDPAVLQAALLAGGPEAGQAVTRTASPAGEDVVRMMLSAGMSPSRDIAPAAHAFEFLNRAGGENGQTDYLPKPFEVGGMKGIVSPRTGSIHLSAAAEDRLNERLRVMDRKALIDERLLLQKELMQPWNKPEDKQYLQTQLEAVSQRLAGADTNAPASAVGPPAKPLDKPTAAAILKEAGGDKDKARALARQRGYTF